MYPSGTNSPLSMSGPSLVSEINIKSGSQYSAIAANSAFLLAMLLALITKVRQLLSFLARAYLRGGSGGSNPPPPEIFRFFFEK